jgi:hypothetical protein
VEHKVIAVFADKRPFGGETVLEGVLSAFLVGGGDLFVGAAVGEAGGGAGAERFVGAGAGLGDFFTGFGAAGHGNGEGLFGPVDDVAAGGGVGGGDAEVVGLAELEFGEILADDLGGEAAIAFPGATARVEFGARDGIDETALFFVSPLGEVFEMVVGVVAVRLDRAEEAEGFCVDGEGVDGEGGGSGRSGGFETPLRRRPCAVFVFGEEADVVDGGGTEAGKIAGDLVEFFVSFGLRDGAFGAWGRDPGGEVLRFGGVFEAPVGFEVVGDDAGDEMGGGPSDAFEAGSSGFGKGGAGGERCGCFAFAVGVGVEKADVVGTVGGEASDLFFTFDREVIKFFGFSLGNGAAVAGNWGPGAACGGGEIEVPFSFQAIGNDDALEWSGGGLLSKERLDEIHFGRPGGERGTRGDGE